jgi:hypothetical protein
MAVVALIAALHYVRAPGVLRPVFDDSYISLLFARNLAEHGRLTFDGHSWSTGATSILHVTLRDADQVWHRPFNATIAFGVASHVVLALAVYWLAWAVFRSLVAATMAAFVIALMNYAAFDAGNGMETSLFMAPVAASMAAVLSWRGPGPVGGGRRHRVFDSRPAGGALPPAAAAYQGRTARAEHSRPCDGLRGRGRARRGRTGAAFTLLIAGHRRPDAGHGTAKLQFFRTTFSRWARSSRRPAISWACSGGH